MRRITKDYGNPPPHLAKAAEDYRNKLAKGIDDLDVNNKRYQCAKKSLESIYNGKCGYCEADYQDTGFTRIDHYRPKSKYKWLIFEWSNLVCSCERCNTHKSDQFPIPDESKRITSGIPANSDCRADSPALLSEKPLIVNPELDNPYDFFKFETDGSIIGKDNENRGNTTIKVCKLNRSRLRNRRKKQIDDIVLTIKKCTERIIDILNQFPGIKLDKVDHLLSFYKIPLDDLMELSNPACPSTFTLLGTYMEKDFECFIVSQLPENDQTRYLVRRAYQLFYKSKPGE